MPTSKQKSEQNYVDTRYDQRFRQEQQGNRTDTPLPQEQKSDNAKPQGSYFIFLY